MTERYFYNKLPTNSLSIIWSLILLLSITGCGPELSLKGNRVNLGNPEAIKQCRLLGNTRVVLSSARKKLLSQKKMEDYLIIEARNFAARIGGDTVLALSAIEDEGQIFRIYNCHNSRIKNKK